MLQASPAVGAWHGQELIGFARAVTDGILRAYVEDVIVAPGWRGRGVGRALLAGLTGAARPGSRRDAVLLPGPRPLLRGQFLQENPPGRDAPERPAPAAKPADGPS